ncbi:hypothetical protein [Ascidiimonas sp. W6]|uniref:hypothetical protein n=1 Tax=Ascidiimonas meishanensis TaxID=3128903 RepID=UPI0030EEB9F6
MALNTEQQSFIEGRLDSILLPERSDQNKLQQELKDINEAILNNSTPSEDTDLFVTHFNEPNLFWGLQTLEIPNPFGIPEPGKGATLGDIRNHMVAYLDKVTQDVSEKSGINPTKLSWNNDLMLAAVTNKPLNDLMLNNGQPPIGNNAPIYNTNSLGVFNRELRRPERGFLQFVLSNRNPLVVADLRASSSVTNTLRSFLPARPLNRMDIVQKITGMNYVQLEAIQDMMLSPEKAKNASLKPHHLVALGSQRIRPFKKNVDVKNESQKNSYKKENLTVDDISTLTEIQTEGLLLGLTLNMITDKDFGLKTVNAIDPNRNGTYATTITETALINNYAQAREITELQAKTMFKSTLGIEQVKSTPEYSLRAIAEQGMHFEDVNNMEPYKLRAIVDHQLSVDDLVETFSERILNVMDMMVANGLTSQQAYAEAITLNHNQTNGLLNYGLTIDQVSIEEFGKHTIQALDHLLEDAINILKETGENFEFTMPLDANLAAITQKNFEQIKGLSAAEIQANFGISTSQESNKEENLEKLASTPTAKNDTEKLKSKNESKEGKEKRRGKRDKKPKMI